MHSRDYLVRLGSLFHPVILILIFYFGYVVLPNIIMERAHWGLALYNGAELCKGTIPYVDVELPHGIFIPLANCISSKFIANSVSSLNLIISLFYLASHLVFFAVFSKRKDFWLLGCCSLAVFLCHPFPLHAWPEYVASPFLFLAIISISNAHGKPSLQNSFFIATNLACVVLIRHSNLIVCVPMVIYLISTSYKSFLEVVSVCLAFVAVFFLVFYFYYSASPVLVVTSYLNNISAFSNVFSLDPLLMVKKYFEFLKIGEAYQGTMLPHLVILSGFLFSFCDWGEKKSYKTVFYIYVLTYVFYVLFGHKFAFEVWRVLAMFGPLVTISLYYSVRSVLGFSKSAAWAKAAKVLSILVISFYSVNIKFEDFRRPWPYFVLPNYYWNVIKLEMDDLVRSEYRNIRRYYTDYDNEFDFYKVISNFCDANPHKKIINHSGNSVIPLVCDNEFALRDTFYENQVYFRKKTPEVAKNFYDFGRFDRNKYIVISDSLQLFNLKKTLGEYSVHPIDEYVSPRMRKFYVIK